MDRITELKEQAKAKRYSRDTLLEMIVEDCAEFVYEDLKYTAPKLAAHLSIKIRQHYGIEC